MLSRAPFVSVVLFLVIGIVAGDQLAIIPVTFLWVIWGIAATFALWFYYQKKLAAFTITLSVCMILLGSSLRTASESERERQLATLSALPYTAYLVRIISLPEQKENSFRLETLVTGVRIKGKWQLRETKSLLYIPLRSSGVPQPGDQVLVKGRLELPMTASNPGQFDYRRYLRNKGILWTDYAGIYAFQVVSSASQRDPRVWSASVSQWADRIFRINIKDKNAYGLVKAMLLGRRDDLDKKQVWDYVISGAVHILSVSGMHVAIIFFALTFLLGWFKRWHFGRWVYFVSIAAFLGFYALIAGLAPSVQRATFMCLVFVIAELSGRKQNSMNTLAISGLLILLMDPGAVYDVGFQLSYLAMTGIFLLYEPIYSLFEPANRIVRFVWQASALAFAAQLATFPIAVYYFHQFPTYFWLVNPFVIAFTNVLLPAALVLLVTSMAGLPLLSALIGKFVGLCAWLTDFSVSVPRSLPGFVIENIQLNAAEVVLLYAIIGMCWYAWHSRVYTYVRVACLLVLLFVITSVSMSLQTYIMP
jgi:competence protein ComEC